MFGIGLGEILIIALIIFLISPKDLPRAMKKAAELFNALNKVKNDLMNINDDIKNEVKEVLKDTDIEDEIINKNTIKKKISIPKKIKLIDDEKNN